MKRSVAGAASLDLIGLLICNIINHKMMTERDKKKAAKAEKKAAKEAAEREKEAKLQKSLIEVFNDKQAKAGKETDAIAKLRQWLQNPPYKSTNRDMKVSAPGGLTERQKETFFSVMQCLQQLNTQQWDALYNSGNLEIDDAVVLNKYIVTAYEMLTSKDTSKCLAVADWLQRQLGLCRSLC